MKSIKRILILFILWFIVHEIVIIWDGLVDEEEKSEYVLVFGNTVNADGTLSDRLKSRVEKGKDLYLNLKADKIFVSGGLGKEGHYEGSKMKEYLVSEGIPGKDIIVDDTGNNTFMTAINFRSKFPNAKSVIVVSQFYHISRTKLSLKKVGIKNVSGVHSEYFEVRDIYSLFREFFAFYKCLLF